ncbi:para-nitrobenzyl esterase-like [Diabrotica undecimpunctata]|uniref:para-nitrobenzyl esterase-like n=1 Tax=Diabrotica undecimpunctata TaxID=50387 RepID=UPI003B63A52C
MVHLNLFVFCTLAYFANNGVTSAVTGSTDDDLIITLSTGSKVRGHVLQSFEGNNFHAFESIPYAEPPIGKNRFQPPVIKKPWEGVLNATANDKICPQLLSHNDPVVIGDEDCLILNVYRPLKSDRQKSLPVFFWIYGGGFDSGYSALYDPSLLIDYDIVIVTINYRVGSLGFLTTIDDNIPGNVGLKDQLLALQWVHDNIIAFGGDPNQVTVGGESAGSMSAGFHLLSKAAKGLYSAIIQQSGSPLAGPFYPSKDREVAFEFGRQLNKSFTSSRSSDLLAMLQEASLTDILNLQATFSVGVRPQGFMATIVFKPVIEEEFNDKAFLTGPMHSAILNGKFNFVPVLIGLNSEESLMFYDSVDKEAFNQAARFFDENAKDIISVSLNIAEEAREDVGKALKSLYTNTSFQEDTLGFIKYSSDEVFGRSIIRQAEGASRYVPVFMYQLSWYNKNNRFPGTGHASDLYYLWNLPIASTTAYNETLRRPILKLWTNFIKYQNPTPIEDEDLQNVIWPEVEPGSVKYLNIDSTFEVQENPRGYYDIESILDAYLKEPLISY